MFRSENSQLTIRTIASQVGIIGVLACTAVGAKKVSICVQICVGTGIASARLGVFAVLARPALPKMTRISAVTGERRLAVIILRFAAASPVEAMCFSARDSGNFTVVAEPAFGAFLWEEKEVNKTQRIYIYACEYKYNRCIVYSVHRLAKLNRNLHNTDSFHRVPTKSPRTGRFQRS